LTLVTSASAVAKTTVCMRLSSLPLTRSPVYLARSENGVTRAVGGAGHGRRRTGGLGGDEGDAPVHHWNVQERRSCGRCDVGTAAGSRRTRGCGTCSGRVNACKARDGAGNVRDGAGNVRDAAGNVRGGAGNGRDDAGNGRGRRNSNGGRTCTAA